MLRYIFVLIVTPIIVAIPLRKPFFGPVAIMCVFILKPAIYGERFGAFLLDLHGVQLLYITTFLGLILNEPGRMKDFVPRSIVDYGILGFLATMIASYILNGDPIEYLFWNKYIDLFFKMAVLYFLLTRLTDSERRVVIVTFAIMISTTWLVYKAWDNSRSKGLHFARPYEYGSHHDFGVQLVMTLPLLAVMAQWQAKTRLRFAKWARRICLLMVPFSVMVGLRTQSRSSFLGLGAVLVLLAWYYRRKWKWMVIMAPIMWFAVVHQHPRVWQSLESIWTHKTATGEVDMSIDSRFRQMRTALRIFQSRPLLGIGPRNYFRHYLAWASVEDMPHTGRYTMHCVPLLILAEEGVVGFFFYYVLIVGGTLLAAWRVARHARQRPTRETRTLAIVSAGSVIGYLGWAAHSLGTSAAWTINIYAGMMLVVSADHVLTASLYETEPAEAPENPPATSLFPGSGTTEVVFP